jgi:hypothetical protein
MTLTTSVSSPVGKSRERDAFDGLVRIIRSEFDEMPGMWLTRAQFRRLWHLTEAECDRLLRHLLGSGFLTESGRGVGRPSDL